MELALLILASVVLVGLLVAIQILIWTAFSLWFDTLSEDEQKEVVLQIQLSEIQDKPFWF
jgi:hypothetical protein